MLYENNLTKHVELEIGGKRWNYSTDYRFFIKYSILITSSDKNGVVDFINDMNLPMEQETLAQLNDLYFFDKKEVESDDKNKPKPKNWTIKYDVLWELIYSAFLEKYRIDLYDVKFLHFKKFEMLFKGLKDTKLNDVINAWSIDMKGMSKKEKNHYEGIRKQYPLSIGGQVKTVKERDKMMLDYVNRRFKEVNKNGE